MTKGFNTKLKQQNEWGWLLSVWLFLGGIGSALFLLYALFALPLAFALIALGMIVIGGAVLLYELGIPWRAWRGVTRLRTSWLSRGALSVALFVLCTALFLAPRFVAVPWSDNGALARLLEWLAILCALMITLYPGMFLSRNRSVPFWNTPWLVLLLALNSIQGAGAIVLLAGLSSGLALTGMTALLVVNIVLTLAYLWGMTRVGGAAAESVRLLTVSPLQWLFGFALLAGMAVPLPLLIWNSNTLPAGACLIVGGFLFRYCLLKAGVYVPSTAVQVGIDFSKLTRRNATPLAQEYAARNAAAARR